MPTPDYDNIRIEGYGRDYTGTIWWDKIKIEKGNKATDWSPAPEDISNNIKVGSVNRLTGTSGPYVMSINNKSNFVTWNPYFTPNNQKLKDLGFKVGDQLTIGLKWEISKNGSNDFVYGNFRTEFVGYNSNGDREYMGPIQNPAATFSASNTKGRSEATVTLTEQNVEACGLRIRIDNSDLTLTISEV